jgi:type II secretory pathway pseudopilin PulG
MATDCGVKPCQAGQDVRQNLSGGFSLVEVCLAILVVGLGLLSVFTLFPSGLRSAEDDTADTRAGLFMESALNGMRANAMTINNDLDWSAFSDIVVKRVLTLNDNPVPIIADGQPHAVIFPDGGTDYLRYRLTLSTTAPMTAPRGWSALLEVEDGRYPENMISFPSICYTEFWFSGY